MTRRSPRWPTWRRRGLIALVAYTTFKAALLIAPPAPLRERFASSVAVYDGQKRLLRLTLAPDQQYRVWTPLPRISPSLVEATKLYEDRHFAYHPGFNPVSLVRATVSTYGGGRRIGGSTLTMQLARRLWDIPAHTGWGKVRQLARAVQLEALYSKREILEAYLNLAPYGGNVEGAGAASLVYFGRPVEKLTLPEALTLAVIPQNPEVRSRSQAALTTARASLFRAWRGRHAETAKDEGLVAMQPAPKGGKGGRGTESARPSPSPDGAMKGESLPFLAPHFVDEVLRAGGNAPEVQTTLELRLQRLLERHVRAYVSRKRELGVKNAAALLVDTRTLEVSALVGSADFRDDTIFGQVNGVLAKRSPGSALKPFVYALGIDQGVIHPETMLKDVPTAFAAYSPENFDGRFAGPISAREALIRSRNIPALEVASKLNRPGLYEFLRTAGISRLRPEAHYGLGLALGNAEVTMEELAGLYAALGRGGVHRPLRWKKSDPTVEGTRILSEEASFMTLDMLADNPRPPVSGRGGPDERRPIEVAWKTGTSWGFRDAWSVGLFGPYVLAVWVGNFSGEGNPAFVGVQAAGPLFFEIVDAIVAEAPGLPPLRPKPPAKAKRVAVCALSGGLPGPSCPHQKQAWFVPGRSPIEPCPVHRTVTVETATGMRACAPYRGPVRDETFEVWPSDLHRLFSAAGLPRRGLPAWAPGCTDDGTDARPPRITSPLRGVTYTLGRGDKAQRVALSAITDGGARDVFWFVDDRYLGRARSGAPLFFDPSPGTYVVRAVDDRSHSDARELRVEYAR